MKAEILKSIVLKALNNQMVYRTIEESSFRNVVNEITTMTENEAKTKDLTIYDNGGESFDRITVVFNNTKRKEGNLNFYNAIGSCETGKTFYQHTTAQKGKHLGKKIQFFELSDELQKRILEEIENN